MTTVSRFAACALALYGSFLGAQNVYKTAGRDPQAGGSTLIPVAIIPVSFVFDEYRDAKGAKIALDATNVVSRTVQSPLFQNYSFSTGNTQFADAVQRAQFWNVMKPDWHILLGQPKILPPIRIEVARGHGYVMRSSASRENFAVIDVVAANTALMQNVKALPKGPATDAELVIYLFHNVSFYGTTLPEYTLWASDPTVCCSVGWHGTINNGTKAARQAYIAASYVDPELLPRISPGLTAQSSAPIPIVSDVQALSEQIVEWLNDPYKFPAWRAPDGVPGTCGGERIADAIFSGEPTRFLLPPQAATEARENGFTYHLQNAALLTWYEQKAPSSTYKGAYSFPDTAVLEGPAQPCQTPIPAPAAKPLPATASNGHALIGYWESYLGPPTFSRLRDIAPQFDVVIVSFASPAKGSKSLLEFRTPYAEFKEDVKHLQRQGKKVLISVGGGGAVVTLSTPTDVQSFVSSLGAIVREYGFDGIDLDIENPSLILDPGDTDFRHPTTASIVNLISACRELRQEFGSQFVLAIVPEAAQAQAGFVSYAGTSGSFLPVIHALRDIVALVDAQDYNTPPLPALDGNFYVPGTSDYHVAMTEMLLHGFPVAGDPDHFFPALPPEKVAIGVPASAQVRNFVSMAGLADALNYLIKGKPFGGQYKLRNSAGYPNLLGMMTWSESLDRLSNYEFSNTIGPLLHGLRPITSK